MSQHIACALHVHCTACAFVHRKDTRITIHPCISYAHPGRHGIRPDLRL